MESRAPQNPQPYPPQTVPPPCRRAYHSDSHWIMALGVVLLCFGGAITHHHEVTLIGLAMIVFAGFID
ncbi:MAG TPA: hypothetical protein VHU89_19300 [Acidobacteriaceae bacterium]|nr:hypothetical protein [Acidobacteriaceae bacterium]